MKMFVFLNDVSSQPERSSQLEKLKELEEKNKTLKSQLEEISGYDPAAIDAKQKAILVANSAANRWTDNIFSIKSYCSSNFNLDAKDFDSNFSIPSDMDYIDKPI